MNHGTEYAYTVRKCRCDACRTAMRVARQAKTQRRRERAAADPSIVPHGTRAAYVDFRCRCDACTQADREYHARWRRNRRYNKLRREVMAGRVRVDWTARRTDPPPTLATPRPRPVYGCDCGAVFTDRRDIARHTCAA